MQLQKCNWLFSFSKGVSQRGPSHAFFTSIATVKPTISSLHHIPSYSAGPFSAKCHYSTVMYKPTPLRPPINKNARPVHRDMSSTFNPYEVLGVSPTASWETIKAQYHALAKKYHPDVTGQHNTAQFQEIQQAYTMLKNQSEGKGEGAESAFSSSNGYTYGPFGQGDYWYQNQQQQHAEPTQKQFYWRWYTTGDSDFGRSVEQEYARMQREFGRTFHEPRHYRVRVKVHPTTTTRRKFGLTDAFRIVGILPFVLSILFVGIFLFSFFNAILFIVLLPFKLLAWVVRKAIGN